MAEESIPRTVLDSWRASLPPDAPAGASVRPRLVWQTADGRFAHVELPDHRPLVVGRDPGADVHGGSARLSRRHFDIQPGDAGFELGDLGSLNGTRVNGSRVTRRILRDGDLIEAGRLIFVYLADGPS